MDLNKFISESDKFDSLYTILFYEINLNDTISYVNNILNNISKINNNFKRKYLNDRIFNFKNYLLDNFKNTDILNNLFLIGKDINNFSLNNDHINELKEFDIKNIIFLNGENYKIDYLNDLLNNKNYYYILYINNKTLELIKFTKTKKKIIDKITSGNLNIINYINENKLNNISLIHGVSSLIKNLKIDNIDIINKKMEYSAILDLILKKKMLLKHKKLKENLLLLNKENTIHRIRFGKEIPKSIRNLELKLLFCTPKRKKKIYQNFSKDLLNFEIIEIISLEKNDIGDELINKYKSAIGVTYY